MTWVARLRQLSELAVSDVSMSDALASVAATARELMPLDFCGVLTPNEDGTALIITGWDGLSSEYVDRINRSNPVGLESTAPSSRAYHEGVAVAVSDIEAERGFAPWGGVAQAQGYRSMISVPLRSERGILGTLNGYHAEKHHYTADETERMMLLANHAAVVIASAGVMDDLRRSNETLVEQRDLLTRSQAIREQLLQASLGSRGTQAVLDTLERIVRRPVEFLSLSDDYAAADDADAAAVGRSVFVEGEMVGELVIRAGEDNPAEPAEDDLVEVAMGHAAAVLSLELLRQRAALDTENRIAGELLQDVLTAGITEQSLHRARAMGFDLATLRVATATTVASHRSTGGAPEQRLQRAALARLLRVRVAAGTQTVAPLVAELRGKLIALWPDTTAEDPANAVHAAITEALPRAIVTVSSSGSGSATLGEAVRIAAGVLDLAATSATPGGVVHAPELGFVGMMLHIDDTDLLLDFVQEQLGAVIDYDARRGTELLATLDMLFALGSDRGAAAKAMRVHVNTVQQRLRRVEALTGRNLASPVTMLDITAALAIHGLTTGPAF
ncbi:MAG: GAF domain-containing protein [Lacisediminihabitans sp.]